MPYREELRQLQAGVAGVSVHCVFTREKGGGRLGAAEVGRWAPAYARGTHAMVCGPEDMIRDVTSALRAAGYPRRAIHAERFAF
jgi:ferredoxin-NADP reductase